MRYDVCVFGGCSLDQMYYLDEKGLAKTTPDILVPGGKGSNQAVAAARAGAKVTIITRIGKDSIGQNIFDNLIYNEISTNNVEMIEGLKNDASKIYIDLVSKDNDIQRSTGAIDSFTPEMVNKYKRVLLNSKIVVAQMKIPKEVSIALINFCYDNSIPIIITPCRPKKLCINEDNNEDLINKISYITANKEECETIFGTSDIEACVTKYPNKLIVTLGSAGVMYHNGQKIVHIDSIEVDTIEDTTGAGDTFNGNLAYCLTHDYSLEEAITRSQFASAMKIQKRTAQEGMPYKEELDTFINNYYCNDSDYSEEFELAYDSIILASEQLKRAKISGVKIKNDASFVTQSDYLVEKIITDSITKRFLQDNFVTEEFNPENKITDRTWIIDPIDGTIHYMKNSIFWGIQLAFIDKGEVQFSIVYLPKLDEMYYALKGKGTFLNHTRITLQKDVPLNQCIVEFCGSLHKKLEEKKPLFYALLNNDVRPAGFMHINTCGVAFANLVSKRTDAILLSTNKPWDIIPGIFLCQEAGLDEIRIGNLSLFSNSNELENLLIKDIENNFSKKI